jgi:hypothetical protein
VRSIVFPLGGVEVKIAKMRVGSLDNESNSVNMLDTFWYFPNV